MKILWLVNLILPEASALLCEVESPYGGWLVNSSAFLSRQKNIELCIVFPIKKKSEIIEMQGENIKYVGFPDLGDSNKDQRKRKKYLTEIIEKVKPDLIHIYGTERMHSLAMIESCNKKNIKVVISIQGLVSVYTKHYMANLPAYVQKNYTFRDFIKLNNLIKQQKKFKKSGEYEKITIIKAGYIIGRTLWDKAYIKQINSKIRYFHCNESLRAIFYNKKWDLENCEKYSLFISQSTYPLKGTHYLIEALPIILKSFPETKLYIGGADIVSGITFTKKIKKTSYAKYLYNLIHKYSLEENIIFTGLLSEKKMCERYLKSHVYVLPSAIENSSNSLGEAMLLGIPCVAAYTGGTPSMLENGNEGFLFQPGEPHMIAYYICELFKNNDLAMDFSKNARNRALETHNIEKNTNRTLEIYKNIIEN